MSESKKSRLILPTSEDGIPNLEIKRMQKLLETQRPERMIPEEVLHEISRNLDQLQDLTQRSRVRGLFVVATLTKEEPHSALTLFSAPKRETEEGVAHELLQYTTEWFLQCAIEIGPPPSAS